MARKKILGTLLMCGLLCLFLAQNVGAQIIEVELEQVMTSATLIGDFASSPGYSFTYDVTYKGVKLGTFEGSLLVPDPPVDYEGGYEEQTMDGTFTVTGFGSCDVTGRAFTVVSGIGYGVVLSYTAMLSNCTDTLANIIGSAVMCGAGQVDASIPAGLLSLTLNIVSPPPAE